VASRRLWVTQRAPKVGPAHAHLGTALRHMLLAHLLLLPCCYPAAADILLLLLLLMVMMMC